MIQLNLPQSARRLGAAILLGGLVLGGVACSRDGGFSIRGKEYGPHAGAIPDSQFFALNAITPFHLAGDGNPETWEITARNLDLAKEMGASTVRIDMWWGSIQKPDGTWDFTIPDRVISMMEERGLEPFPILCYNSSQHEHTAIITEENRRAFGEYVYQMVSRYKGRVTWWEVWNEPNIEPFWAPNPDPQLYTLLLEETWRRGRQADPRAKFVGMCTAGADYAFIESCYRLGAGRFMDAVSFHHYSAVPEEAVLEREIRRIRRLMDRYGDGHKPLLITELGLSTGYSSVVAESTPEFQASWMVKKHLLALATGVDQFHWFKLVDDPVTQDPDGFWGFYTWDVQRKPAANAYQVMTSNLEGLSFIGEAHRTSVFQSARRAPRVYVFGNSETTTAVAWMENDRDSGAIRLPSAGSVTVEDLYGELVATIDPREDGTVTIPLAAEPRYIRGLGAETATYASFRVVPEDIHLSPGEQTVVSVYFHNTTDAPVLLDFSRFQASPASLGLTVTTPENQEIRPGKRWKGEMKVALSPEAERFNTLGLVAAEGTSYGYTMRVHYEEPFEIFMRAEEAEHGVRIVSEVTNLSQTDMEGTLEWRINGGSRDGLTVAMDRLKPLETQIHEMEFEVWPGENVFSLHLESQSGAKGVGRFRLWGQQMVAENPVNDGSLEEWSSQPHVWMLPVRNQFEPPRSRRPLSPEESSARVYGVWTETHFHLAVDVTDPTPFNNPFEGSEIWRGDSIEIYLGANGPSTAMSYTPGNFQFALSPGMGEGLHATWNWRSTLEHDGSGAPLRNVSIQTRQTESGWLMEASIPVEEFGLEVQPYRLLGFDMHVNNKSSDGSGDRESVLLWNGDGNNWKTPRRWGAAMILPDPTTLPASRRSQLINSATVVSSPEGLTTDPEYLTPLPVEFPDHAGHLPNWLTLRIPWNGPFLVSNGYGFESRFWTHQTIANERSANDFFAIDADLPVGEPVVAAADGIIISSSLRTDSYGNYVVIDHGRGYQSIYTHLDSVDYLVHLGEPEIRVKAGDRIGTGGSTGTSWPHLHFGVHFNARQSHSGANVGGITVVPEPLGGFYGIRRGMILDGKPLED